MDTPALACCDERRRDLVRLSRFFGLDYVEVSDDQLTLTVVFLGRAPADITAANVTIAGGERITNLAVTGIDVQPATDPALDDTMLVTVDQPGDFSTYRLCVRALDGDGHPTDAPMAGFDPRYACAAFTFKAGCPTGLDCAPPPACPPPARVEPEINYLAKDYDSFRQLILDRLAVIMPGWQERHVPDVGVALVELLAYAGDQLSYYQDAVATEAYLATARRRISVRRHARLVDYAMHEGCNARAWVCVGLAPAGQTFPLVPADTQFVSGIDSVPALAAKTALLWSDLDALPAGTFEVFEPLVADPQAAITLRAAHSELRFYTWGDRQCRLPAGTTRAVLLDAWAGPPPAPPTARTRAAAKGRASPDPVAAAAPDRTLALVPGDVLIFEEVKGPATGNPADADPAHRWAVRLIRVTPTVDTLIVTADGRPTPLVEIEWASADALPFAFCLSVRLPAPDCRVIGDVSLARGNVILVDHGRTLRPCEDLGLVEKTGETGCCACEGSVIEMTTLAADFRPALRGSPLTFAAPFQAGRPASAALAQDPRQASPAIRLRAIPPAPDGTAALFRPADLQDDTALAVALQARADAVAEFLFGRLSPDTQAAFRAWNGSGTPPDPLLAALAADLAALVDTWLPLRDLLESGPDDDRFVVEMDDDRIAHLRFGDGACGRRPDAGTDFLACYRVGNGAAGNVGADRITKLAFRATTVEGLTFTVRNPLPARNGTEPEPVAEVKLFAPGAFRQVIERAITAADYAAIAGRNPRLQRANAELRWTGSWYEASVAVDPLGSEAPDDTLLRRVQGYLTRFRRLGHDLAVEAATYVPLRIGLAVCVLPQYLRGHVEAALLDAFSNRVLPDGSRGFFHPDNLTFGGGIARSRIVAAAQAVPGVAGVTLTAFQRLYGPVGDEVATGFLPLGPTEIARLDNDPNYPEHGVLMLDLEGGR